MNPVETRLMCQRPLRPVNGKVIMVIRLIESLSEKDQAALADRLPDVVTERVLTSADHGAQFWASVEGKPAAID